MGPFASTLLIPGAYPLMASTMTGRRSPSPDTSNVALVAAAGALAAISSVGLLLLLTSKDRRSRFKDSKELYIPSRYLRGKRQVDAACGL